LTDILVMQYSTTGRMVYKKAHFVFIFIYIGFCWITLWSHADGDGFSFRYFR